MDIIQLSKHIVTKCAKDNCHISNLYLQKILYYIQRNFIKRKKIAFRNDFEAWQFGPVIPSVYYYFCGFGAMPIIAKYEYDITSIEDREIIDAIVEAKRLLKPWHLVADTHNKNGAWEIAFRNGRNSLISKELIKQDVCNGY